MSVHVRNGRGFTLIELLVVVAIIALLISILLPSLNKARAQARTTLCLSRVSQLTKAMLMYADDFNETLPFVATGHNYGGHNCTPDPNETWLMNCMTQPDPKAAIKLIAYGLEADWPEAIRPPKSGTLFTYTRFETLYRCPEFERINDATKTHNAFNYTRTIWGRFYKTPQETNWEEDWGDVQGPIMKPSKVFAPSANPMMIGEQWNRHVAVHTLADITAGVNNQAYNCADCLFAEHNVMELAHGQPVASEYHKYDISTVPGIQPFLWPRAGVGFYDGHGGLVRDPWPTFELGNNKRYNQSPWRAQSKPPRGTDEYLGLQQFIMALMYFQRGKEVDRVDVHW